MLEIDDGEVARRASCEACGHVGLGYAPYTDRKQWRYRALLISGTFEPHSGLSPEAYRRYVEDEIARWAPIVKALDLRID